MNSEPSDQTNSRKKPSRRWWLISVVGLFGLVGVFFNNRSHDTRPVYLPVPLEAGGTAATTFVPTTSDTYELEIELRAPADRQAFEKYIRDPENGGLSGDWTISMTDGAITGKGKLSSYLYTSMTGPYRRRARQVVGLESYRDISALRIARGIGRFAATARKKVQVQVDMHTAIPPDAAIGEPHLVARLNRRRTAAYLTNSMVKAALCLVLCLLPIGVAALSRIRQPA